MIQRDINRTFPAHDYFKEAGGLGQDSLYRMSKAYAVYDSEVGYCQGLSFLAATLLLHVSLYLKFALSKRIRIEFGFITSLLSNLGPLKFFSFADTKEICVGGQIW